MNDAPRFGWQEDSETDARPWADWPRCPRCGTRRDTACPDCAVPGADFALAELDPAAELPPVPSVHAEHGKGCGAGHTGCCGGPTAACCPEDEDAGDEDAAPATAGAPAVMLVCPTCDEAFVPRFFRRCRQCEHDFGSGLDAAPEDEPLNYRVGLAILAVLAAAAGIWIYLLWLFRQ